MTAAEKHFNKKELRNYKNVNGERRTNSMLERTINQSPLAESAYKENSLKKADDLPTLPKNGDSRFRQSVEVSITENVSPKHIQDQLQEQIKKANLIKDLVSVKSIASSVTNF